MASTAPPAPRPESASVPHEPCQDRRDIPAFKGPDRNRHQQHVNLEKTHILRIHARSLLSASLPNTWADSSSEGNTRAVSSMFRVGRFVQQGVENLVGRCVVVALARP